MWLWSLSFPLVLLVGFLCSSFYREPGKQTRAQHHWKQILCSDSKHTNTHVAPYKSSYLRHTEHPESFLSEVRDDCLNVRWWVRAWVWPEWGASDPRAHTPAPPTINSGLPGANAGSLLASAENRLFWEIIKANGRPLHQYCHIRMFNSMRNQLRILPAFIGMPIAIVESKMSICLISQSIPRAFKSTL